LDNFTSKSGKFLEKFAPVFLAAKTPKKLREKSKRGGF
jgi:hypothetical protein